MRITCVFLFLFLGFTLFAQNPQVIKYSETITATDLKKHLTIFASDDFEGRNTGSHGLTKAATYLSNEFKKEQLIGPLKNNGNPYYQNVELLRNTTVTCKIEFSQKTLVSCKDFILLYAPKGIIEKEFVFVGYGIDGPQYSDLKNIDVKGKIVAFCVGEPVNTKGTYLATGTDKPAFPALTDIQSFNGHVMSRVKSLFQKGASGCMIIDTDDKRAETTLKMLYGELGKETISLKSQNQTSNENSIIYIPLSKAKILFDFNDKKYGKILKNISKKQKSPAGEFVVKAKITNEVKSENIISQNVVALCEGTDLKDEIIIVSAHYDHLGIIDGQVYNGADDDGSGSVALLEIAQAFMTAKKDGFGPRRSILFIGYMGEEKGLLGSKYYAGNTIYPKEKTMANLNIDMIGRIDKEHAGKEPYLYLIGPDYISTELKTINEEADKIYTPKLKLDYFYNDINNPKGYYYRSDHYPLASNGVPSVCYFSGVHEDYHKPTDDVDKIDFSLFELRARMIFATLWELANRNNRLVIDKKQ